MPRGRIRGLDGIRALAALMVFAEHQLWPAQRMFLGGLGVELFFVLSGYLIVGILSNRASLIEDGGRTKPQEIWRFFVHRSFRIFPPYYALIGVMAIISLLGLYKVEFSLYPYYLTYTTNLAFAYKFHGWPHMANFGHFWSLAIEEQFYIFSAPVLLCVRRRSHALVCLSMILAAAIWSMVLAWHGVGWVPIGMDSIVNFGYLSIGGLLSQVTRPDAGRSSLGQLAAWAALIAIALACLVLSPKGESMFLMSVLIGVASGCLIHQVIRNQQSAVVNALEVAPLRWLGRISYGFYLYHIFIKLPATGIAFKGMDLIVVVNLAISILLAQASWLILEQPSLKFRDRFVLPFLERRPAAPAEAPLNSAAANAAD